VSRWRRQLPDEELPDGRKEAPPVRQGTLNFRSAASRQPYDAEVPVLLSCHALQHSSNDGRASNQAPPTPRIPHPAIYLHKFLTAADLRCPDLQPVCSNFLFLLLDLGSQARTDSPRIAKMVKQETVVAASKRHPKPENTFQYGTAGVSCCLSSMLVPC
jgi:hypothetical protein